MESETFEVRVGTDVQSIEEVKASIERFGDRYVRRVFTDHEVECSGGPVPEAAAGLCARFAAKEATIKLLEITEEFRGWKSIEVRRSARGGCSLRLDGSARDVAERAGVRQLAVSISHGAGVGLATVVGLCESGDRS